VGNVTVLPPSTCATWRTTGDIRVLTAEILDKGRIQNLAVRDPRPLLRPIALPVHQVLEATATAAYVQEPPDRVGRVVVNDPGRRRSRGRRRQRTGGDRFDLGHMERGSFRSFRRTAQGLMTDRISKGPMNRGESFLDSPLRERSFAESHTFWPGR